MNSNATSKFDNEKKKANCLGCGKKLEDTGKQINICAKCIMQTNFEIQIQDPNEISGEISKIFNCFINDVTEAFHKDPAAKSLVEVLTSYPGIQAVLIYRIAHFFWKLGLPFVPRYISELAHQRTGIDIHPGAEIGDHFFIDHGTGVVIGETSKIGENVTIYQGAVLGGVSLEQKKRHPTLGNNIVVGAGAKLLGPIKIGDNVRIGANSVVTKDVPPNSVVVGVPGRKIEDKKHISEDIKHLSHGNLPDPVVKVLQNLESRLSNLEKMVK
jgi:serine O-acetyltransferase